MHALDLALDRQAATSLSDQIGNGLRNAIRDGRLAAGTRLPSWRDLASQLGVARGTVRVAYERLVDEQLLVAAGAAGTRVAQGLRPLPAAPAPQQAAATQPTAPALPSANLPLVFRMAVPPQDVFPAKVWTRIMGRAARSITGLAFPDEAGESALRAEIAAYLAIARGLACSPAQVFVTHGYAAALALACQGLALHGGTAWVEDPGYPMAREALRSLGLSVASVAVDAEGFDTVRAMAVAPRATLAVVTAGQQAPLGVTLSLQRRHALLAWAERTQGWIVEDDYLGELQLRGRAAPSLASLGAGDRVLHIGTFSKAMGPGLRIGFLVVPPAWADRFATTAFAMRPAPAPWVQKAMAEFMRGGHYLRHLRRMRRVTVLRRDAVMAALSRLSCEHHAAGLSVLLRLPDKVSDEAVARQANRLGLAPTPLSPWYAAPAPGHAGLLLGVTNVPEARAQALCRTLVGLIPRTT
jgi:GntR family transcriptional regulator / MocR family aminotransferase